MSDDDAAETRTLRAARVSSSDAESSIQAVKNRSRNDVVSDVKFCDFWNCGKCADIAITKTDDGSETLKIVKSFRCLLCAKCANLGEANLN